MKRIIIFEGADGCGKSVLATELARKLDPAILTRHGPYPGEAEVWRRYLVSMLPAYADIANVVMDRSWISEPIYGAAYRGGANRISVAQRRMLERVALGRGAGVVLCRVPWSLCAENFKRRKAEGGEYLDDTAQLKVVYDGYRALEAPDRLPTRNVVRFNYASRDVVPTALAVAENLEAPLNLGPGIGAWAPGKSILIVGERPGGGGGRWHLPFVSLRRDGCSAWLADLLEEGGIPEAALYWVNAYDGREGTGAKLDHRFVDALAPRAVVALGDVAARWCREAGIGYDGFDHPKHHKRFNHSKPYPLISEVKKCMRR